MRSTRARVPVEGSLAKRVAQRAAERDLAGAEAHLRREQRGVHRMTERLLRAPPVSGRGGFGRAAGRVAWRMRLPPLVTTSAQLCSLYPLVCDPGLGVDGPLIGQDVYSRTAMCFDLHELYRAGVIT